MNPSLRNRFWLLVIAVLSLLPFLLSTAYSLFELSTANEQELTEQLIRRGRATANAVNQRVSESTAALNTLATSPAAMQGDTRALYEHALRVLQRMPEASAMTLIDGNGKSVFFTLRPWGAEPIQAGDPKACEQIFATGKPVVSEPFKAPGTGRYVTAVGVPVFQGTQVKYCLRMILRADALNVLLANQGYPADWTTAIVSRTGVLMARSRSPELFVGTPANKGVLDALAANDQQVFEGVTKEGERTLAIVLPVGQSNWSVVVGVPHAKLVEPAKKALFLLLVYGAGFCILGTVLAWWLVYLLRNRLGGALAPVAPVAEMPRSTLASLLPSLGALLIAMVLGGYAAWQSQAAFQQIVAHAAERQQTHIERRHVAELLSSFKDIENGQRGYVITGNPLFLEPYEVALLEIPKRTANLKKELNAARFSGFNWPEFEALAAQRIASAAQGVELRKQQGSKAVLDERHFEEGRMLSSKLRVMLSGVDAQLAAQGRLLDDMVQVQSSDATRTQWLAFFTVGGLLVMAVAIWLYERRRRVLLTEQLKDMNANLESRVDARTHALQVANQRIRTLAFEAQEMLEMERKRLSREVHDQIGQIFTGIKMIARTLKPGSLDAAQEAALLSAVETGVKISRRIAAELRPPLLDDFGLRAALEHMLKTMCEPVDLSYELQFPDTDMLTIQQKMQVFRMVQEATTNVVRHARAQHVEVVGTVWEAERQMNISIDDDGVGFAPDDVRDGALGIVGMRERGLLMGADVHISPRAGGGTRVAFNLPLDAQAANATAVEVRP